MPGPDLHCLVCGSRAATGAVYPVSCGCGGLWSAVDPARYLDGIPDGSPTPLWKDPREPDLWWKREDLSRTGSFKDRGAEVLAAVAWRAGARRAVLDSSGSAALAGASAAARAGIALTVHVPAGLPRAKREALACFGASIQEEGSREAAAARAQGEASEAFYLSHVHHPAFTAGTSRAAGEVLSQLRGGVPETWVVPVGNGSLLLGLAEALDRHPGPGPRLIAVQAAASPGLRRPGAGGKTAAVGIGIGNPPRRRAILEALKRRGGDVIEVDEEEIAASRAALWHRGLAVELASAAALAGIRRLRARGPAGNVLGFLTGSGLRGGG